MSSYSYGRPTARAERLARLAKAGGVESTQDSRPGQKMSAIEKLVNNSGPDISARYRDFVRQFQSKEDLVTTLNMVARYFKKKDITDLRHVHELGESFSTLEANIKRMRVDEDQKPVYVVRTKRFFCEVLGMGALSAPQETEEPPEQTQPAPKPAAKEVTAVAPEMIDMAVLKNLTDQAGIPDDKSFDYPPRFPAHLGGRNVDLTDLIFDARVVAPPRGKYVIPLLYANALSFMLTYIEKQKTFAPDMLAGTNRAAGRVLRDKFAPHKPSLVTIRVMTHHNEVFLERFVALYNDDRNRANLHKWNKAYVAACEREKKRRIAAYEAQLSLGSKPRP